MQFPRLPDGLIYAVVVVALVLAALGRRENTEAPPAPPAPSAEEGDLLAPASAFDPSIVVKTPTGADQPTMGTAFSIAERGVWLTARHVIAGCARIALVEAPGRAAAASLAESSLPPEGAPQSDVAVLLTKGGAPAIPLLTRLGLRVGERSFHPGYPQGRPGEATSRLIGRQTLVLRSAKGGGRAGGGRAEQVLAWAEAGRTDGLNGDLAGLSGAPALNVHGEVVGVTIAEAPRRGRIYTTTPEAVHDALTRAHVTLAPAPSSEAITGENYGRVADGLRRDLRVAQVVCLGR